jgi:hypothetical protein
MPSLVWQHSVMPVQYVRHGAMIRKEQKGQQDNAEQSEQKVGGQKARTYQNQLRIVETSTGHIRESLTKRDRV